MSIQSDIENYKANKEKYLEKYEGLYIAILGGKVVDSDKLFSLLAMRVYEKYGYKEIFMPHVVRRSP